MASRHELALAVVVAAELAVFALVSPNFATGANAAEIVRLAVEIGLLALALTPVIVSGGIDLSCGALLGLSAITLGALWRDGGWSLPVAAAAALMVGGLGGALNAWLIAYRGLPALMVTLGSLSLFRGLAEGITGAVDNYTGLPASFLSLGQGYLAGVPRQAPVLLLVALGCGVLLHRTTRGRAYYAIGWNAEAARHAGVNVSSRLAELYVLSGLAAGLAAIIYVAHLGQAKADAGTGYELTAITAVVLGGAAITGGVGTIGGTILGLLAMVVLQNGLRLAALPAELAGILTGVLLMSALALPKLMARYGAPELKFRSTYAEPNFSSAGATKDDEMKNSQLAVLCGVVLLGAAVVATSNWWLVRSLRMAPLETAAEMARQPPPAARTVIGMMPKAKGDPYFVSCRKGAEQAASDLNVDLIWDGPTELDPARQNEVVEAWITRKVDVIAVSVENQAAISTVLRKARSRGIKVLTWDADSEADARDFLVNQATPQGIGGTLADEAARLLGGAGEFAIVTASLSAANQNEWIKHIRARLASAHPKVRLAVIRPSDGDRDRAFAETQTILKVYPNVRVVMGIAAPAVPGIAEAVKQSGRSDVKVTGLSLPNMCKPYVHAGIISSIVLWNTGDLGYLTVVAGHALHNGLLEPGATKINAMRLGDLAIDKDQILLGKPFVFTKENIDRFDF